MACGIASPQLTQVWCAYIDGANEWRVIVPELVKNLVNKLED